MSIHAGQVLHVHAPAAGVPLEPAHGFRVASVIRKFTAAAVLRLVEEGRVALDDAIGRVLPPEYVPVLREGGYDPDRITVRHTNLAGPGPDFVFAALFARIAEVLGMGTR